MLCHDWKCVGFDVDGGDAECMRRAQPSTACPSPTRCRSTWRPCRPTWWAPSTAPRSGSASREPTPSRCPASGRWAPPASCGQGARGPRRRDRCARVAARDGALLGADVVLDARTGDVVARLRELTGGEGIDVGVECSGDPGAQNALLDAARRLGRWPSSVNRARPPSSQRPVPAQDADRHRRLVLRELGISGDRRASSSTGRCRSRSSSPIGSRSTRQRRRSGCSMHADGEGRLHP